MQYSGWSVSVLLWSSRRVPYGAPDRGFTSHASKPFSKLKFLLSRGANSDGVTSHFRVGVTDFGLLLVTMRRFLSFPAGIDISFTHVMSSSGFRSHPFSSRNIDLL